MYVYIYIYLHDIYMFVHTYISGSPAFSALDSRTASDKSCQVSDTCLYEHVNVYSNMIYIHIYKYIYLTIFVCVYKFVYKYIYIYI